MWDYIQVISGGIFILMGIFFIVTEVLGVYRFKYSVTRIHAAALGDTGGLFFTLLGLIILNGLQASSIKIAAIVAIMWITSPVSGHLLSMMISHTDDDFTKETEIKEEE